MVQTAGDCPLNMDFDLICAGSGITVLSYVLGLLKKDPGKKVLILEKHRLIGGYSTCFIRPNQNSVFDVSLHKLTGMGKGGNLLKILEDYGLTSEVPMIYPETMFLACSDHQHISVGHDKEALFDSLKPYCHEDDFLSLQEFFSDVLSYGYDSYMQHQIILGNHEPDFKRLRFAHKNLKEITVYDRLKEKFSNNLLRNILSVPCIYVGAFPEQTSYLYFLHVWYACFFARTAYPIQGSQSLADFFRKEIEKRGGIFKPREAVTKIHLSPDGQNCEKIETHKSSYTASQFVFNTSHDYILSLLKPKDREHINFKKSDLPQTASSTTTVYIVLHEAPEALGLTAEETIILPPSDDEKAKDCRDQAREAPHNEPLNEDAYWSQSSIEVTNYHLLAPDHGCVIVINALDRIEHWPERKTQPYKEKKMRAQTILVNRLVEKFPLLRDSIKYVEVASPKTYVKYTNNTNGSGYGYLVSGKSAKLPLKICDNLKIVSQWVSGGGYEATIGFGHMLSQMEK